MNKLTTVIVPPSSTYSDGVSSVPNAKSRASFIHTKVQPQITVTTNSATAAFELLFTVTAKPRNF